MKPFSLLLLLLLVPATALPQSTYDLSCENVARIRIGRLDDTYWNVESYQGHFHIVNFMLKPEAAKVFGKLCKAAPWVTISYRGEDHDKQNITLTANGKPLRDDAPALAGFADQGITITIIREKDAFDTARSVCPALVPAKVLIDWEREGNDW